MIPLINGLAEPWFRYMASATWQATFLALFILGLLWIGHRWPPALPGYTAYLRKKIREFAETWHEAVKSGKTVQRGGCLTLPSEEIVQ